MPYNENDCNYCVDGVESGRGGESGDFKQQTILVKDFFLFHARKSFAFDGFLFPHCYSAVLSLFHDFNPTCIEEERELESISSGWKRVLEYFQCYFGHRRKLWEALRQNNEARCNDEIPALGCH
jgi:hypothetical protein